MLGDTILFATFKEQGEGPPKGSNKYSGKNNVTKHKWQREGDMLDKVTVSLHREP